MNAILRLVFAAAIIGAPVDGSLAAQRDVQTMARKPLDGCPSAADNAAFRAAYTRTLELGKPGHRYKVILHFHANPGGGPDGFEAVVHNTATLPAWSPEFTEFYLHGVCVVAVDGTLYFSWHNTDRIDVDFKIGSDLKTFTFARPPIGVDKGDVASTTVLPGDWPHADEWGKLPSVTSSVTYRVPFPYERPSVDDPQSYVYVLWVTSPSNVTYAIDPGVINH